MGGGGRGERMEAWGIRTAWTECFKEEIIRKKTEKSFRTARCPWPIEDGRHEVPAGSCHSRCFRHSLLHLWPNVSVTSQQNLRQQDRIDWMANDQMANAEMKTRHVWLSLIVISFFQLSPRSHASAAGVSVTRMENIIWQISVTSCTAPDAEKNVDSRERKRQREREGGGGQEKQFRTDRQTSGSLHFSPRIWGVADG